MLKVLINEEEVLTNKDFTIKKEMLNTPSVILNNVYPKTWEDEKDYTSNFYHPQDYSKCKIIDENIVPAEIGETITGTSFTIEDYDSTKLVELTELEGNTTQSGTPTPSSPQPINVVSGRQEVDIVGNNNLFDISTITENTYIDGNGNTGTSGVTNLSDYIEVDSNNEYILSYDYQTLLNTTTRSLCYYNANKEFVSSVAYSPINKKNTFTTPNNVKYLRFAYDKNCTNIYFLKVYSYEINLGKQLLDYDLAKLKTSNTGGTWVDNVYTFNGTTYTYNENGTITLGGVATSTSYINLYNSTTKSLINNSSQIYTYSKGITNTNVILGIYEYINGSWVAKKYANAPSTTYTPSGKQTGQLIRILVDNGTDFTTPTTIYPQLEKGSQATSYTPYKTPIEVCKINTYKDMIFRGKGVNLFDKDTIITGKYIDGSGNFVNYNNNFISALTKIDNTKQYYVNASTGNTKRIAYYDSTQTFISRQLISTYGGTLTIPNNAEYLRLSCYNADLDTLQLNEGTTALPYEPYNSKGKWYLHKEIGKVVLNGSEEWIATGTQYTGLFSSYITVPTMKRQNIFSGDLYSNYFTEKEFNIQEEAITKSAIPLSYDFMIFRIGTDKATNLNKWKTWLSTHNTTVYYILATPTTTEITDSELISQLNAIELLEGLNNVSVSSADLPGKITIHYNYTEEQTIDDLLFCGVVKNSGNISLNPREPHFQSLQILDFKTFLSEGELDSFVIYQKTILEAIQMVIANIQDYGFILGNVNILNPTDVIGAYSTKDKTAYDVFNYIADITQSRWTTRLIDENHVAIDFYDPTLMVEGTPINYTQAFFENNLIDDMTYSYGSNNYRNKQVMTSSQVYSNISQQQSIVANGYQTQFPTEQPIGKINSITSNGIPLTFATFNEKEMGYVADFYYSPGDNYFESEDLRTTGEILIIDYVAIVEGRQIITNPLEIDRINDSTGRKGIISRYEQRNDATTSTELQKIGESYIKYKGTPEIKLKISTRKNIWEVGQRVQFNAPIEELDTEYMVRTKKINYISTIDTIFYEYELISSFNSETEINYFDNQRAKASGNIGEGEYISRNIDIESTANIIFYDTETTEVQVDGDNVLNSVLNSPFTS